MYLKERADILGPLYHPVSISTTRHRGIISDGLLWIGDRPLDKSPWVLIFSSGYDLSCRAGSFSVLSETAIALPLPQMLFCGSSQSMKYLCMQPQDAAGQVCVNLKLI